MALRVAQPTNASDMVEHLVTGITQLRRAELILTTPRAVAHAHPAPADAEDEAVAARGSRAGLAAATSLVQLMWLELDGSSLDRAVAQDYARKIIASYLDQVARVTRQGGAR